MAVGIAGPCSEELIGSKLGLSPALYPPLWSDVHAFPQGSLW